MTRDVNVSNAAASKASANEKIIINGACWLLLLRCHTDSVYLHFVPSMRPSLKPKLRNRALVGEKLVRRA
jgi:hypothetical protein